MTGILPFPKLTWTPWGWKESEAGGAGEKKGYAAHRPHHKGGFQWTQQNIVLGRSLLCTQEAENYFKSDLLWRLWKGQHEYLCEVRFNLIAETPNPTESHTRCPTTTSPHTSTSWNGNLCCLSPILDRSVHQTHFHFLNSSLISDLRCRFLRIFQKFLISRKSVKFIQAFPDFPHSLSPQADQKQTDQSLSALYSYRSPTHVHKHLNQTLSHTVFTLLMHCCQICRAADRISLSVTFPLCCCNIWSQLDSIRAQTLVKIPWEDLLVWHTAH